MKIGFTSFGGMSMVPLILEEMTTHGWMTPEDLSNLVAIAEMTPGPLGINCATFTGTQTAGFAGSVVAVLGVLMPAFTLTMVIAIFFEKFKDSSVKKFKDSSVMRRIMFVVKPICIAMILSVIVTLSSTTYFVGGAVQPFSIGIAALMLYLLIKRKWSVPMVIMSSAMLGVIFYGVLPMVRG